MTSNPSSRWTARTGWMTGIQREAFRLFNRLWTDVVRSIILL